MESDKVRPNLMFIFSSWEKTKTWKYFLKTWPLALKPTEIIFNPNVHKVIYNQSRLSF